MKRIFQWVNVLFLPFLRFGVQENSSESRVTRISVMASGKIFLDGKAATVAEVRRVLEGLKAQRGTVWYYRERGKGEPPAQAVEIFKFIVENKLPISLSTQPDFSDFVDEKGQALPRS